MSQFPDLLRKKSYDHITHTCADKQTCEMSAWYSVSSYTSQPCKGSAVSFQAMSLSVKARGHLKTRCPWVDEWTKMTHTQWSVTQPLKTQSCHLQQLRDLEIRLSEISQTENKILYDFTYKWNLKNNKWANKTKITDTEKRMVRSPRVGAGEWVKQEKQMTGNKLPVINETWGCSVQQGTP